MLRKRRNRLLHSMSITITFGGGCYASFHYLPVAEKQKAMGEAITERDSFR